MKDNSSSVARISRLVLSVCILEAALWVQPNFALDTQREITTILRTENGKLGELARSTEKAVVIPAVAGDAAKPAAEEAARRSVLEEAAAARRRAEQETAVAVSGNCLDCGDKQARGTLQGEPATVLRPQSSAGSRSAGAGASAVAGAVTLAAGGLAAVFSAFSHENQEEESDVESGESEAQEEEELDLEPARKRVRGESGAFGCFIPAELRGAFNAERAGYNVHNVVEVPSETESKVTVSPFYGSPVQSGSNRTAEDEDEEQEEDPVVDLSPSSDVVLGSNEVNVNESETLGMNFGSTEPVFNLFYGDFGNSDANDHLYETEYGNLAELSSQNIF